MNHPRNIAACFEALGWIACAENDPRRATVLMAAAQELGRWVGVPPAMLPDLAVFHDECERRARDMPGDSDFEAARRDGQAMSVTEALDYALED